ncbi:mannitol-1-phosphate 5-dehydrogenase [uncultured Ilyobacter sp.]|uniref:mannitol-1-phosphate 5-dehydrogenase n=1 Tax=uncultured Ilyobacter sp. TaxID=544433 RepID=UPI0029C76238|nr:mannitol-1-phosphate 5-dehydrogenase [uncultured Ilyobacter sp.]
MKTAIQFGAGNIGRGFIGKLLSQSGYKVYFVDVNEKIIDELKNKKEYTVEVVGEAKEDILVKNVDGVMSTSPEVLDLISEAEIITTAVGPNVLKIIAKTIAKGIEKRIENGNKENLNIIACENMINGSSFLKEEVEKHISSEALVEMNNLVGFPNSAVDRIVPPMEESDDVLKVRVEQFKEWIVEEKLFKGKIPKIEGMQLTDNLMAFVERKLFTLNTGHAITAYLGVLKGYETVKESIEDREIAAIVKEAMKESGEVLINRYGFQREKHSLYIDKIINRFKNPYLKDEVSRVGREPLRKLSFNDRLIKPLRGTIEYNTKNDNLIKGIAAALKYRNSSDEQAIKLEERLNSSDLKTAIEDITSLSNKAVIEKIIKAYS